MFKFLQVNGFILITIFILLFSFILRVYKLDLVPPSPYWEEVALGYDAYSILKTGKDHHGNFLPVVAFQSFGDWKPSLYFYFIIPFIEIFGLSVNAVRFPSAIAGSVLVAVVGWLAYIVYKDLFPKKLMIQTNRKYFALISMFFCAINPWTIQFSRGGWEVNLATLLFTIGVALFLTFIKKKKIVWGIGSIVMLILSMYTYHALRIIAPLIGACLLLLWFVSCNARANIHTFLKFTVKEMRTIFIFLLIAGLMLVPLISKLLSPEVTSRIAETSIFNDLKYIELSNSLSSQSGNNLFSKVFYHRYIIFGKEIFSNFLNHLNLNFLFLSGDLNPRHSIQLFGLFYPLDLVFFVAGIYMAIKKRSTTWIFLCLWLIIGLIPASITKASPHALRILPTVAVWIILLSTGFVTITAYLSKTKIINHWVNVKILSIFILVQFIAYQRTYWKLYPTLYAKEWQYGYEEMINNVIKFEKNNPSQTIFITREEGRPSMYYWFFSKTSPELVQKYSQISKLDNGEFLEFENKKYINSIYEVNQSGLVVSSKEQYQEFLNSHHHQSVQTLFTVNDLQGKVVWIGFKYVSS